MIGDLGIADLLSQAQNRELNKLEEEQKLKDLEERMKKEESYEEDN